MKLFHNMEASPIMFGSRFFTIQVLALSLLCIILCRLPSTRVCQGYLLSLSAPGMLDSIR